MLHRHSLLILAVAASCISIQAQDARVVTHVVKDTVRAWATWKAADGTLKYPGHWIVVDHPGGDTVVVFRKPAQAAVPVPQVSLLVNDGKDASTASRNRFKKIMEGSTNVISSSGPDPSGAYEVEYASNKDGTGRHYLERAKMEAGRSFTLIYSAEAAVYGEYLFMAEAMMNSFLPGAPR